MKRIKDFLDLLVSFVRAWPIILSFLSIGLAIIVGVSKIGGESIQFSLPLWVLILIVALALYPFGKLIEFVVLRRKAPLLPFNGLLWKAPILSFRYPLAICPREGCGCEVICKEIPPPPFRVVAGINDIREAKFEYSYQYECPIHGALRNVPNESLNLLQHKAKLALKY